MLVPENALLRSESWAQLLLCTLGEKSDHSVQDGLGLLQEKSVAKKRELDVLRAREEQGLRLIRELCNHSIAIWLKANMRNLPYRQPVTPIPIVLSLPWGEQTFWGDGQVYLWFRGVWGNHAVQSALMALEQWALERFAADVPFD